MFCVAAAKKQNKAPRPTFCVLVPLPSDRETSLPYLLILSLG